jgi:hypothetical protein
MPYYVCECGTQFDETQEGAQDHMLEEHLDLVESRYEEFLEEAEADPTDDRTDTEIYDEALDDVTEEMLDCFDEYDD